MLALDTCGLFDPVCYTLHLEALKLDNDFLSGAQMIKPYYQQFNHGGCQMHLLVRIGIGTILEKNPDNDQIFQVYMFLSRKVDGLRMYTQPDG